MQTQSSFWDSAALNLLIKLNTVLKRESTMSSLSLGGRVLALSTCALPLSKEMLGAPPKPAAVSAPELAA